MLGKIVSLRLEKLEKEFLNSGGEWKEFKLSELFIKKTIKGVPKKEENLKANENGYHMFGQNIKYQYPQKILLDDKYLQKVEKDKPIIAYTSSSSEIGMIDESFYRSGDNGAFQGLFPKFTKYNKRHILYILTLLQKHFINFGYSTGMSDVINLKIMLPFLNGEIYFTYMEKYIEELEALCIEELDAYLLTTGLKDYKLTKYDEEILGRFNKLSGNCLDNKTSKLDDMTEFTTGEFTVRELFGEEFIFRGKRIKSSDRKLGDLPFVTAGTGEMGISSYICREQTRVFSKDTLTIDMFGNVFYRGYKYGADDHVTVLENSKNKFSRYCLQFMQPLIEKFIEGQFTYSRNFYPKDSYDIKIKLPVHRKKLDCEFMEKFIIVVQKLVIRDVVLWADKKIEATRQEGER